ncbi:MULTISPECIES: hypothetical protein [Sphaerospermopsis]|uniref:hypothetical protein n=1 Tax=Sphaerospermopsis TaxID=752201 RepID=UPI00168091D6|nr:MULTISPECIES: hypothetical protein [Sphaerospermopsis]
MTGDSKKIIGVEKEEGRIYFPPHHPTSPYPLVTFRSSTYAELYVKILDFFKICRK